MGVENSETNTQASGKGHAISLHIGAMWEDTTKTCPECGSVLKHNKLEQVEEGPLRCMRCMEDFNV